MCRDVHVELLEVGWKWGPKREKAALCGCGLLENVADLAVQRCRRTRREPSSSNERRRKVARRVVRVKFMIRPYSLTAADVKRAFGIASTSRPRFRAFSRGRREN